MPKFRAVTNEGKIIEVVFLQFLEDGSYLVNKEFPIEEGKLLQWTGLKDKKGKEIFAGDILQYDDYNNKKINYEVVYCPDAYDLLTHEYYIAAYFLKDKNGYHSLICNVTRPYQYAEIIGNIFQHPHLLK